MEIKEELLQFIWKYRLFSVPLKDMDDLPVELVDPGQHNRDSGPDFFNARIRSEGILWAGNIEIHIKASAWYQHGHHLDPAFDNVILHVVLEPDCQVMNSKGREIRTARMEIPPEILIRYGLLMNNPEVIPCWRRLHAVDKSRMNLWMERLLIERLEERVGKVMEDFGRCAGDWQEVLYVTMARAFGQKVNADPFEMLARSVSKRQILDNCPDQSSREAILFGQAGMLEEMGESDHAGKPVNRLVEMDKNGEGKGVSGYGVSVENPDYHSELCRIYSGLKNRLDLQPIDGFLWKFLRLRPDNFPTIRISQLASSLGKYPDLFGQLVGADDPMDLVMGMEIRASEYWNTHYRFGIKSPAREKKMGKNRLSGLFVNAFLPVLLAIQRQEGKRLGGISCPDGSMDFPEMLMRIPAEDNRITRMWKKLGLEVPDVLASQAILQLTNNYCIFKRCLSCYVGSQIFHTTPEEN